MGMARTFAAVFGAVYVALGLAGFALEPPLFGAFEVNLMHNLVHLLLGAVLLYGTSSTRAATMTTLGVGTLLVVLGILGFPLADGFGLVPLGGANIWLHLVSGMFIVGAGFLSAGTEGTTR